MARMKAHPLKFQARTAPRRAVAPAFAILVALALASPATAFARDRDDQVEALALLQRGEILPLGKVLPIVQQNVPGDVIEVELDHDDDHGWEYEIKVLTANGRVREVKLDARTGMVRKIEDD